MQSLKINDSLSMEEVYTHIKDYVETERRKRDCEDRSEMAHSEIEKFSLRRKNQVKS